MTDQIRAAIISLIQSIFPVLNLTGALHLTSDEISVVMLLVTNALTLIFLIVKPSQPPTYR